MTTSSPAVADPSAAIGADVTRRAPALLELSHTLHSLAELAFEEHASVTAVTRPLEEAGFDVHLGVAGLPTAFVASYGSGDLNVGICAEYDALPEIGHACGHNIIATSAVGAALALAPLADELGLTVSVIGTPAEEHGGGKVLMLQAGVFDDLACALMVHPGPADVHPIEARSQGVARFAATFSGRAAHAAAAPHLGVNAADASVVSQVAIGLLRQQLPGTARVAAFVRDGGQATNIIPERVVLDFEVREFDLAAQRSLQEKVFDCFRAGALATGCAVSFESTEPEYEPLAQDPRLAAAYVEALAATGRDLATEPGLGGGSTDMGNVSQYLPAIHPIIGVLGSEHPPHTHGFADEVRSAAGDDCALAGAAALAATVATIARDADVRAALLREQSLRAPYARATEES